MSDEKAKSTAEDKKAKNRSIILKGLCIVILIGLFVSAVLSYVAHAIYTNSVKSGWGLPSVFGPSEIVSIFLTCFSVVAMLGIFAVQYKQTNLSEEKNSADMLLQQKYQQKSFDMQIDNVQTELINRIYVKWKDNFIDTLAVGYKNNSITFIIQLTDDNYSLLQEVDCKEAKIKVGKNETITDKVKTDVSNTTVKLCKETGRIIFTCNSVDILNIFNESCITFELNVNTVEKCVNDIDLNVASDEKSSKVESSKVESSDEKSSKVKSSKVGSSKVGSSDNVTKINENLFAYKMDVCPLKLKFVVNIKFDNCLLKHMDDLDFLVFQDVSVSELMLAKLNKQESETA